ncbi:hypothetical protein SDJN02_02905, partial [Cucurbita argyrosperma subsp. argyrosperma]
MRTEDWEKEQQIRDLIGGQQPGSQLPHLRPSRLVPETLWTQLLDAAVVFVLKIYVEKIKIFTTTLTIAVGLFEPAHNCIIETNSLQFKGVGVTKQETSTNGCLFTFWTVKISRHRELHSHTDNAAAEYTTE